LAVKFGLVGLAGIVVAGLFSLMMTWWSSPIDRVNGNGFTSVFDQRGIVPIGYAAFAFALGVTAGVLIRRTLPAMATALGGFVFVRVAVTFWVRPHLETAVHTTSVLRMTSGMGFNQTNNGPLSVTGGHAGAWVFSDRIVDSAGHAVGGNFLSQGACLQSRSSVACIGKLREVLVYQPASRYWAFQSFEMAIFLGLAVVCSAVCFWWMRRRVSWDPGPSLDEAARRTLPRLACLASCGPSSRMITRTRIVASSVESASRTPIKSSTDTTPTLPQNGFAIATKPVSSS
jgi:hypothetical protein